jgi:hypothetical protein
MTKLNAIGLLLNIAMVCAVAWYTFHLRSDYQHRIYVLGVIVSMVDETYEEFQKQSKWCI